MQKLSFLIYLLIAILVFSLNFSLLNEKNSQPLFHDEFSYLLAADTFAQGRITNPPHSHSEFFETFHVIQKPSYTSKYPPGQSLILAAGKILFGEFIFGSCLFFALLAMSLIWMLRSFLPLGWSVLGSLIVCGNFQIITRWGTSYWGGALAMLAAALAIGAIHRMKQQKNTDKIGLAVIFGFAGLLLSLSRPLEGLVLMLVLLSDYILHFSKVRTVNISKQLSLIGVMFLLTITINGIYNKKVTGSYLTLPYFHYTAQHNLNKESVTESWLASSASKSNKTSESEFNSSQSFKDIYQQYFSDRQSGMRENAKEGYFLKRSYELYFFFFGLLPLAVLSLIAKPKRSGINSSHTSLAVIVGINILMTIVLVPFHYHYYAALAPAALVLLVLALRHLFNLSKTIAILLIIVSFSFNYINKIDYLQDKEEYVMSKKYSAIEKRLPDPFRHLVFVKYSPDHNYDMEWVYNMSDIDSQKVVWARFLNNQKNQELINYYPKRKVWLFEPDNKFSFKGYR